VKKDEIATYEADPSLETVVVLDVGAGTTDMTVVRLDGSGVAEVLLSAGIPVAGTTVTAALIRARFPDSANKIPPDLRVSATVNVDKWKQDQPFVPDDVPYSIKRKPDPTKSPLDDVFDGSVSAVPAGVVPGRAFPGQVAELSERIRKVLNALLRLFPLEQVNLHRTVLVLTGGGSALPTVRRVVQEFARDIACVEPAGPELRKEAMIEGLIRYEERLNASTEPTRRTTGLVLYSQSGSNGDLVPLHSSGLTGSPHLLRVTPPDEASRYSIWESALRLDQSTLSRAEIAELKAGGLLWQVTEVSQRQQRVPTLLIFDAMDGHYRDLRLEQRSPAGEGREYVSRLPRNYLDRQEY
jgi:hypothetical protein